ncbi:formate dehydrogenase accessory protein FdhE [Phosphitispora fastidiosa]|uniref:formate dehydrogenase accessory protein FdhE n=1 Tax=Phosphitispora fastidiosa TaxID=2837202 RepID=UPI001E58B19B|nr:formate dehydrogenase accessory protein FdhE [Phosphitispora fastidiosa]MBU7006652.1 FdhE protein [Phosphitispora fastidiosa]
MPGDIDKGGIPHELLNFYRELIGIQKNYFEECSLGLKASGNAGSSGGAALQTPLLQQIQPAFDTALFIRVFRDITGMIARNRPGLEGLEAIDKIPDSFLSQSFAQARNSSVNEVVNKDNGLLKFIFTNSIKPFLKAFAQSMEKGEVKAAENHPFCPVCGGSPDMGRAVNPGGQRYLHCSLCGHEWLSKRLKCPYCLNEDHNLLSVIIVDDIPGCRIDVCEACGSYLKVIADETGGVSRLPEMADIETIYLDVVANQRGYTRSTLNI